MKAIKMHNSIHMDIWPDAPKPTDQRICVSHGQMNIILMAVEHGFRQCERGANLETALKSVFDLYEIEG